MEYRKPFLLLSDRQKRRRILECQVLDDKNNLKNDHIVQNGFKGKEISVEIGPKDLYTTDVVSKIPEDVPDAMQNFEKAFLEDMQILEESELEDK